MVSTTVLKKKLLGLVGLGEQTVLDALPEIKCSVEAHDEQTLTVEVTGDRPDLLSVYGMARALKGFLGKEVGLPQTMFKPSGLKVFVDPSVESIRPVFVGAVIENVSLSDDEIAELFSVQEKLDLSNGRRRKKVSIGLYDLDTLRPPFYFKIAPPSLSFTPLKREKPMMLQQILQEHETGKDYAHLISARPHYPVLFDSKNQVLALIPIINSAFSAVTTNTKRIFIDHTGTDLHACNTSLNILCHDLQDAGAAVRTVEVHHASKKLVTPDTKPEKYSLTVEHANKLLGTNFAPKEVVRLLKKQRLDVDVGKNTLECFVPRYRADFLQEVDVLEEIAIAHGFNAFTPKEPSVFTVGSKSEQTYAVEKARDALASFGFQEVMTHIFTSPQRIEKAFSQHKVVRIRNPVSDEYSCLRSSLLPGLLEVLSKNTHLSYPQKIFEVGEVVVKDPSTETRTRTDVHAGFALAHSNAGLSEAASYAADFCCRLKKKFALHGFTSPRYVEGRSTRVNQDGEIGEIHPAVLENYGLSVPVVAFEMRLIQGER